MLSAEFFTQHAKHQSVNFLISHDLTLICHHINVQKIQNTENISGCQSADKISLQHVLS